MIIILMGVSGSGKSAVGKRLSQEINCPFFDGDDYHSEANRKKMEEGIALSDEDRLPWLQTLSNLILKHVEIKKPMILACSALKKSYRTLLNINSLCQFVYLKGSFELIKKRLKTRSNHFFNPQLLQTQFKILEEPQNCLVINIEKTVEEIVCQIQKKLNL